MSLWCGVDGAGAVSPSAGGGGQQPSGILRWWNPLNSLAIDSANVYAYRAQASVGSPWPFAPAVYADTLQNWANPGVNDLVEGNGAVPWAAATGWWFNGFVSQQYFDTNLVPANDQSWVMFVQYSNTVGDNQALAGMRHAADRTFTLQPRVVGVIVRYQNGNFTQPAPQLDTGNLSVVGNQGYRNGVAEGGIIPPWGGAAALDIYIGGYNTGIPTAFITANIQAVLIADDNTAFTGADITAIAGAAGSMQNL